MQFPLIKVKDASVVYHRDCSGGYPKLQGLIALPNSFNSRYRVNSEATYCASRLGPIANEILTIVLMIDAIVRLH